MQSITNNHNFKQDSENGWGEFKHPSQSATHNNKTHAFTLIELLIVISIIAVLMGILIPSLSRARKQARRLVCSSNMRQIGIATQAFLIDSDYSLPPSSCHITNPDDYWLNILSEYTQEQLLFHCPSEKSKNFVDWNKPLDQQTNRRYSSFAVNALLDPICWRYGGDTNPYNRIHRIVKPQSCIWISEAPDTENFELADHIHPESWDGSLEYAKSFIAWDRHLGQSNYLFVDGHVETLDFEQTYQWPNKCFWYPETAPRWPANP